MQVLNALDSYKTERQSYEHTAKEILKKLRKPLHLIPSPNYQSALQQLTNYLEHYYDYRRDDQYIQIYVNEIEGKINFSLMQLANELKQKIGGELKFWQNKIIDVSQYVCYSPTLSIWQTVKEYQKYLGLSPEFISNLNKFRSLSKRYLADLYSIIKLIDRAKPEQSDLYKIDQHYKKVKKSAEKYHAFLEETQLIATENQEYSRSISFLGKKHAKNTLFRFVKGATTQAKHMNTLQNYNFTSSKQHGKNMKLLKGREYEQLDEIYSQLQKKSMKQLNNSRRSNDMRQGDFSSCQERAEQLETSQQYTLEVSKPPEQGSTSFNYTNDHGQLSYCSNQDDHHTQCTLEALRLSIIEERHKSVAITQQILENHVHFTYIFDKNLYFCYHGYPPPMHVKSENKQGENQPACELQFALPFKTLSFVNYNIDDWEEYDELLAEDLSAADSQSSASELSNPDSFIVSDNYDSDNQEKSVKFNLTHYQKDRWFKVQDQIDPAYQAVCIYTSDLSILPLPIRQQVEKIDSELAKLINGKSKAEILTIFEEKKLIISKNKMDLILKSNFKKIRTKNKFIFVISEENSQTQKSKKSNDILNNIVQIQSKNKDEECSNENFQPRNRSLQTNNEIKTEECDTRKSDRVLRSRKSKQLEQKSEVSEVESSDLNKL